MKTYWGRRGGQYARVSGPNWEYALTRVAGYWALVDYGPGWHKYIVIDRATKKHYCKLDAPTPKVYEITQYEARQWFRAAGRPYLRPVMEEAQ